MFEVVFPFGRRLIVASLEARRLLAAMDDAGLCCTVRRVHRFRWRRVLA
jgi:hypothetical protein